MPGLSESPDPLLKVLQRLIRIAVRGLAILMTVLILLGVVDVAWILFQKAMGSSPRFMLSISDILATFGAFLAVLIAIEIFVNIVMYLREDVIHVKIVVATALMAIARKVIILDFSETNANFVWAMAGVILATSIAYWLVDKAEDDPGKQHPQPGPASPMSPQVPVEPPTVAPAGKPGATENG
jgi:uncharacterized membrane protein (DUF373 family)